MRATPEQIAAAWGAWRARHGGNLGPGPGFVEAINAALALEPVPEPVEWQRLVGGFGWQRINAEDLEHYREKGAQIRALYVLNTEAP